jgi:MFS transporter, Spinster family, sphingosine-1-phosphate transporter
MKTLSSKWSLRSADAPRYAQFMLILLFFINLLNYIDRLVISGLLEPIRKNLGLNDAQLGTIALAFLVPYTILPPFVGWIGDRAQRTKLIAGAIGVWSFATAAAGLAVGFRSLVATRIVVGVGESTYMTSAPSLIADTFAPSKRGAAMSLFYTASPIGAGLGVTLGGLIAAVYGWRSACLIVGIPGILLALILLYAAEPRRGHFDPDEASERPELKVAFRALIRNRPFLLLVFAYTFQILSYNPIEFWVPTILQRDKGISLAQTSATYGAVVFVAGLLGPLVGGLLGDMLAKRQGSAYYTISALSSAACVVPLLAIAILPRGVPLFAALFGEIFLGNMSTGLVFAILVGIVAPGLRGTATAVTLLVIHLLGDGISQPLIGRISNQLSLGSPLTSLIQCAGSMLHVPVQSHLSLALVTVSLPTTVIAAGLYLLAASGRRRPPATAADAFTAVS